MTTEKTGVSVSKGEMKTDICSTGSASQKKKSKIKEGRPDCILFCQFPGQATPQEYKR